VDDMEQDQTGQYAQGQRCRTQRLGQGEEGTNGAWWTWAWSTLQPCPRRAEPWQWCQWGQGQLCALSCSKLSQAREA